MTLLEMLIKVYEHYLETYKVHNRRCTLDNLTYLLFDTKHQIYVLHHKSKNLVFIFNSKVDRYQYVGALNIQISRKLDNLQTSRITKVGYDQA